MNHLPIEMGEESERRRQAFFDAQLQKRINERIKIKAEQSSKSVEPNQGKTLKIYKKKKPTFNWVRQPKKSSEFIDKKMKAYTFLRPYQFAKKLGHDDDTCNRFAVFFNGRKDNYLYKYERKKELTKGFKGKQPNRYFYEYEIKDLKLLYEKFPNQIKVEI